MTPDTLTCHFVLASMSHAAPPLPERTVKFRFPKVADFTDPEYDKNDPEHWIRAKDQRLRESFVAHAEMLELQQKIIQCRFALLPDPHSP